MVKTLIEQNFDLDISEIKLIESHFGTDIYCIFTNTGRYIVKVLPVSIENTDSECDIAEFLSVRGLKVARFLKSKSGAYVVKTQMFRFTVQEFIEGETLPVNSAPEWFMVASADFLGRSVSILKDYKPLPVRFGSDFFSRETVIRKREQYSEALVGAKKEGKEREIPIWEEQIGHLDRILEFRIDTDRLTYANSHGDYYIGQAIVKDQDITVIDWTAACRLPVVLDVIMSYALASPACAEGAIDAEGLVRYIKVFAKHFALTDYDIKTMPYVFYFWYCTCNYRPDELDDIASGYQPLAKLIFKLLNWLHDNVDELSGVLAQKLMQ